MGNKESHIVFLPHLPLHPHPPNFCIQKLISSQDPLEKLAICP
jgi:hypothetical protein